MSKLAVIGIGGNSIIRDKYHQRVSDQYEAIKESVRHIADIVKLGWGAYLSYQAFIVLFIRVQKRLIQLCSAKVLIDLPVDNAIVTDDSNSTPTNQVSCNISGRLCWINPLDLYCEKGL